VAGPNGDGAKQGLEVGEVTLQTFRTRMRELVDELNSSPAEHKKIGEQKISAASYGTGFAAAADLHAAYEKVRARLEELTRIFGDTIEGMGIRAHIADKGYSGVDQEERDRFAAIQRRTGEDHDRHRDPAAKGVPGDGTADKPAHGTTDTGGFS
jgi:hypothetical protein